MRIIFSLVFLAISFQIANAQQFVFATLDGSPVMNTTGWNLVGSTVIGDTPGDFNTDNDELILTPAINGTSGGCFWNQPLDLSLCNTWTAEFDFRINDGNGADGIAFCFLTNPPTGFIFGGGVGIPNQPEGLMVVLDVFDNCGGNNPELQIRYGDGINNYSECPATPQPTIYGVSLLRQQFYQRIRITYVNGNISVYLNGFLQLTGFYPINYAGYLGFTSSTGGLNDRHSIRNVIIYTDMPISDAGTNTTMCSADTISIGTTPRPNYSYSWSPTVGLSDSTASSPDLSIQNTSGQPETHVYYVTVDSAGVGCTSTDSVVITVLPEPQIDAGSDRTICSGESTILGTTANAGVNYQWSPGNLLNDSLISDPQFALTNNSNAPTEFEFYLAIDSGSLGCSNYDTVKVTVVQELRANAGVDVTICSGGTDTLGDAALPNYTYTWSPSNGLSDPNISDPLVTLSNTTGVVEVYDYILTVDSAGTGCIMSDTVRVSVSPPQSNVAGPDVSICGGDSTQLSAVGGIQFTWSPASGLSDSTIANPIAFPNSTTSYILEVVDAGGCIYNDTLTVTVGQALIVSSSQSNVLCNGDQTGIIDLNVDSGTAPFLFSWADGVSTEDRNGVVAGSYAVTVTDDIGCQTDLSFTIAEPTPLTVTGVTTDASCFGNNDGEIDLTISGGVSPYTNLWNNGAFVQDIVALSAGTYTVTVSDSNNCPSITSYTINEPSEISISLTGTSVTCNGAGDGSVTANVSGGNGNYTYQWSNGETGSSINNLTSGTFSVTVTDANACTATESISITEPGALQLSMSSTEVSCGPLNDGTATVIASGGSGNYVYNWSSIPPQTGSTAFALAPGSYSVTITDQFGCSSVGTVTVWDVTPVTVNTDSALYQINAGESVSLGTYLSDTFANVQYSWNPSLYLSCLDCPEPVASPLEDITYIVTILDENGCYSSDTSIVEVEPVPPIYVPNAFSPNGDGVNDLFFIYADGFRQMELNIYNRWGELVFSANDPSTAWDGTFKGKLLDPGVFIYDLDIILVDYTSRRLNGSIQLLR